MPLLFDEQEPHPSGGCVHKKKYSHWTMRKVISEGPQPQPGYYIDKNSIRSGINRYTGMGYYCYTEIKVSNRWDSPMTDKCG